MTLRITFADLPLRAHALANAQLSSVFGGCSTYQCASVQDCCHGYNFCDKVGAQPVKVCQNVSSYTGHLW
jgi:hypothetical protein